MLGLAAQEGREGKKHPSLAKSYHRIITKSYHRIIDTSKSVITD